MNASPTFYRRHLPHWHPHDSKLFLTFRLANSLPSHVVRQILAERKQARAQLLQNRPNTGLEHALYALEKRTFGRFDEWLDQCANGPNWLEEPQIAQIVADQIQAMDGERYRLIAYCIMANHVHLVIDTAGLAVLSPTNSNGKTANYAVADTMRLLKGRTARYCNQALARSGQFWHHESYDHVVRDAGEENRIIRYILNNPVKAELVNDWQEWRYSYWRRET